MTKAEKQLAIAKDVLNSIAAWDDKAGNDALKETGSYGGFDEPASVQQARKGLQRINEVGVFRAHDEKRKK